LLAGKNSKVYLSSKDGIFFVRYIITPSFVLDILSHSLDSIQCWIDGV